MRWETRRTPVCIIWLQNKYWLCILDSFLEFCWSREIFIICQLLLRRWSSSTEGNTWFRLSLKLSLVLNMQNIYLRECCFLKEELKLSWRFCQLSLPQSARVRTLQLVRRQQRPSIFTTESTLVELLCGNSKVNILIWILKSLIICRRSLDKKSVLNKLPEVKWQIIPTFPAYRRPGLYSRYLCLWKLLMLTMETEIF